jgi:hypothetical protein
MDNICRDPTFGDFVTILTKGSMQDNTVAKLARMFEYKSTDSPLPTLLNAMYILRESLSEDSQNIPCATLKRKGSWVISTVYVYGISGLTVL